jgi:hypothetical protein
MSTLATVPLSSEHIRRMSLRRDPGWCRQQRSALQRRDHLMLCSPASDPLLSPCELTDAEWTQLAPWFPGPARRGRPRSWPLRLLVNAVFYVLRTGCAWRALPREYPPWQPTYTTCRQWRWQGGWQCVHEAWRRGPPASGSPRQPLGGDHGQPEGENHGSIRWHQGL